MCDCFNMAYQDKSNALHLNIKGKGKFETLIYLAMLRSKECILFQ